ncbi:phosphatidate cytidylyltransferase [Altererythrobacter sp. MF3-039]|uniref:phosphatidate cytidylyltransferase n=1 Tax=Altererythrobacter sp. MF3-039 TaxID=3252901 RepID=UPI00390C68C5
MADAENPAAKKNSDLPVRLASAIVMLAVAGTALWLDGIWFDAFALLIGVLCVSEFGRLAIGAFATKSARLIAILLGGAYIALAAYALILLPIEMVVGVIALVIAVDVGAYFTGRAIGGPKIAPSISPSKTWAGLFGGMVGAALVAWVGIAFVVSADGHQTTDFGRALLTSDALAGALAGSSLAVVAQAGDFFESWLKRRAGVKDSSSLIPGHGGVFDRVDGLLPVALIIGGLWSFLS